MENQQPSVLDQIVIIFCSLPGLQRAKRSISECVHQFFRGEFTVDNTYQMIGLLNMLKQAGGDSQHGTIVHMMLNMFPFAASELTMEMRQRPNFHQEWYTYCQALHQELLIKTSQTKDLRVSPQHHESKVIELVRSVPFSNLFRCHYDFKEYDYVDTKLNELRDNSFFDEYALITKTALNSLLCFRERTFRTPVFQYSEDQWRILLNLLGHQLHGAYMLRKWDQMENALVHLKVQVDWLGIHHSNWEWAKINFAKAKIMSGAAYLKQKMLLEADREVGEGIVMLKSVRSQAKYSTLGSLYYYAARINAERGGFDTRRFLHTTVDRFFQKSIRLAFKSGAVKNGIEMSLTRMQYLLACNTYTEFVMCENVNDVELKWCGEQLKALSSHELISGELKNSRTEQLYLLTLMNYCIRTRQMEEFQLAHDRVMYSRLANVDNRVHLQDRRIIVTASWIKSPVPQDEKLTYTELVLIQGTNETQVLLAITSNGEFVVVKKFFIKKTQQLDLQEDKEEVPDDKQTRDKKKVTREVAALELFKDDPQIVQLIQCDYISNDDEEIYSLVLEHANGDEQHKKFRNYRPVAEKGLAKDPDFVSNDLENFIRRHGEANFSRQQVLEFILGLAKSLRSLHRRKIVHRDVKPQNFLVFRQNDEYILKLCDLAESRGEELEKVMKANPGVGNFPYRDPQVQNNAFYHSCHDVYSFGVVLARILYWSHWRETLESLDMKKKEELIAEELQRIMEGRVAPLGVSDIQAVVDKFSKSTSAGEKLIQKLPSSLFRRLALRCVNENTYLRPDMEQVVQELEKFDERMFDEDDPNEKMIFEFDYDSDTEDPDQEYPFNHTPKPRKKPHKFPAFGNKSLLE